MHLLSIGTGLSIVLQTQCNWTSFHTNERIQPWAGQRKIISPFLIGKLRRREVKSKLFLWSECNNTWANNVIYLLLHQKMLCIWIFHHFQLKKTAFVLLHHTQDFSSLRPPKWLWDLKVNHGIKNLPKDPPTLTVQVTQFSKLRYDVFSFLTGLFLHPSVQSDMRKKTKKNTLPKHTIVLKSCTGSSLANREGGHQEYKQGYEEKYSLNVMPLGTRRTKEWKKNNKEIWLIMENEK